MLSLILAVFMFAQQLTIMQNTFGIPAVFHYDYTVDGTVSIDQTGFLAIVPKAKDTETKAVQQFWSNYYAKAPCTAGDELLTVLSPNQKIVVQIHADHSITYSTLFKAGTPNKAKWRILAKYAPVCK